MAKRTKPKNEIAESVELVRFTIAIPPDLHERLKADAEADCRTLVGQVAWILKKHLKPEERK